MLDRRAYHRLDGRGLGEELQKLAVRVDENLQRTGGHDLGDSRIAEACAPVECRDFPEELAWPEPADPFAVDQDVNLAGSDQEEVLRGVPLARSRSRPRRFAEAPPRATTRSASSSDSDSRRAKREGPSALRGRTPLSMTSGCRS